MLIATRALLGLAGATLMPSTLGLIREMFVDPRQRAVGIGVWAAVFSAGTAIGPLLGGLLLDHFWWGSVFLLGVPIMVGLLVLGPVLLPEVRDPDAGRLDVTSAAMSLVAVLAVIYGLKQIAENGLGGLPVACMVAGLAVGVAFLFRQRTLTDPLIDLRLFRVPAFSVSLTSETLGLFAWVGTYLFVAQYLQLVHGLSPFRAGLWLLPATGGSILGSMLAPVIVRRIRPAVVMAAALVIAAAGFALLTQVDVSSGLWPLVTGSVIFSVGIAPVVTLGTDMIVGAAPPERAGAASAISESGTELGLALGVAVIGSLGTAVYRNEVSDGIPAGIPAEAARSAGETLGGAVAAAQQLPAQVGVELLDAAREAFTLALQRAAVSSAVVAVGIAVVTAVLLGHERASAEPEPVVVPSWDQDAARRAAAAKVLRSAWAPGHCGSTGTRSIDSTNWRMTDMSLSRYEVRASIAVSDMAHATEFYEGKLGLSGETDPHDDSRVYACGGGTSLHVYTSPANAGQASATLATWQVTDLEQVVDELAANGVTFEQYNDDRLHTDQKGLHTLGNGKVAWFKDPDGNTFAIEQ
jgi:DHA2 family multidrug resistance protein-like MFS transporter